MEKLGHALLILMMYKVMLCAIVEDPENSKPTIFRY